MLAIIGMGRVFREGINGIIEMRGPPRVPTALRILRGNPSRRPLPQDEPQLEVYQPDPPDHLSELAKEHWTQVVSTLAEAQVMTKMDTDALALYCENYGMWINAIDQIRQHGLILQNAKGRLLQNPYLKIANDSQNRMLLILKEFGMTPAARTRVQAIKDNSKSDNPWDHL